MFKIPRQPLAELSQTLGALLIQGSSENKPIILHDIGAVEFRSFLQMLYPAFLSKVYVSHIIKKNNLDDMASRDNAFDSEKRIYTTDKWLTILKLSTKFRCLKLRKEALRSLELSWNNRCLMFPSPTKMVQMGRSFWVEKWLICGYKAFVERERDISEEEMLEIGSTEAFRLMRIRELKRKEGRNLRFNVNIAIQQVFQHEITLIAAEEKKYEFVEMPKIS